MAINAQLSQSFIFSGMRDYYSDLGPLAWQDGIVPSFITSNRYIADCYAEMLVAIIQDSQEKIYIVEVGAGHGKFGFYVINSLLEKLSMLDIPSNMFCYILTDISDKNIEFCKSHPQFQDIITKQLVDFAVFNAEADQAIHLQLANTTIVPGELSTPIALICNYVMDTLSQDAFQIVEGNLYATELKMLEQKDKSVKCYIEEFNYEFVKRAIDTNFYQDKLLNQVLEDYKNYFLNAAINIPIGGIKCIKFFSSLTTGNVHLLTADKGYINQDAFPGADAPHIAKHGSISFMVNFHAIAEYFNKQQGYALTMFDETETFQICYFTNASKESSKHANYTYANKIQYFSPADFFTLQSKKKDDNLFSDFSSIISIIHLSCFDSRIFYDLNKLITPMIDDLNYAQKQQLFVTLQKVSQGYYPLESYLDVPLEIARAYCSLEYYHQAMDEFTRSLEFHNNKVEANYGVAYCYYQLGDFELSREFVTKTLNIQPEYIIAKDLLKILDQHNY